MIWMRRVLPTPGMASSRDATFILARASSSAASFRTPDKVAVPCLSRRLTSERRARTSTALARALARCSSVRMGSAMVRFSLVGAGAPGGQTSQVRTGKVLLAKPLADREVGAERPGEALADREPCPTVAAVVLVVKERVRDDHDNDDCFHVRRPVFRGVIAQAIRFASRAGSC